MLMTPHGFTKEHNQPRSHTFALLDQYVVDRAFGGRFDTKDGWRYLAGSGDFNVMDVVVDRYPDNTDQKPFRPGTAAVVDTPLLVPPVSMKELFTEPIMPLSSAVVASHLIRKPVPKEFCVVVSHREPSIL